MIYKLYSQKSQYLTQLPETGMGYQIVKARKTNLYYVENFVVYNSELILELNSDFNSYKSQIINEGYASVFNRVSYIDIDLITPLQRNIVIERKILSESLKTNNFRKAGGSGAIDNPKKQANGEDFFFRLSAYENDKRIDFENKRLKPGSYTTTLEDYVACVKTNDNPIDRYALPNDEQIKWSFVIRPQKGELYQEGIVQPAFGHNGGGTEAYFHEGTRPNTYLLKLKYGQFEL